MSDLSNRLLGRGWVRTLLYYLPQSQPVIGIFGNWFTEVKGLTSPVVDSQIKVMCGDAACHSLSETFDGVNRCTSSSVLKYNAKARERCMESSQVGYESDFGI